MQDLNRVASSSTVFSVFLPRTVYDTGCRGRKSTVKPRRGDRFPKRCLSTALAMGQSSSAQNPSSRKGDGTSATRRSAGRLHRSQPGASRKEESGSERWFHGECTPAIPSTYVIPEMENSLSDDEDDGEGDQTANQRDVFDCAWEKDDVVPIKTFSYQPPTAAEKPLAEYRATFRTIPSKPKKLARPTSVEEVRCRNVLMTADDRQAMELAHGWSSEHHSPNISLPPDKPLTIHRRPIAQSTDAVRSAQGYSKGVHIFEIHWPVTQRGTHPLVGVSLESLKLRGNGYIALLGSDELSWGWDMRRMTLSHNDVSLGDYPTEVELPICPNTFYLILDMDEGTVAFEVGGVYLGVAFSGLKGLLVYPAISAVWGSCEIKLRYIGGTTGHLCTLQQICRKVIRSTLTDERLNNNCLDQLPLPRMVKGYIACEIP